MSDGVRVYQAFPEHFPFEDAILLEDCAWLDADAMREEFCHGDIISFCARGVRHRLDGVIPSSSFLAYELGMPVAKGDSLVGFLVALQEMSEDSAERSSLLNIAVSNLEQNPILTEDMLVRAWQEECTQCLWRCLEVDLRNDDPARVIFARHRFCTIHPPQRGIPVMVWEPS